MRKQTAGMIGFILILLTLAGCAQTGSKDAESITGSGTVESTAAESLDVSKQYRNMTFTEAVGESDCIAVGKFVLYEDKNAYAEYIFEVTDVWRGEIGEKNIHVFHSTGTAEVEGTDITYKIGKNIYTPGEEYVLIMTKLDSLFYDYTHYGFFTDIYIPVEDTTKSTMLGQPLEDVAGMNISAIKLLVQNIRLL